MGTPSQYLIDLPDSFRWQKFKEVLSKELMLNGRSCLLLPPDSCNEGLLLIVGAIFFLIGLIGGGFEIQTLKVPSIGKLPRMLSLAVGIILIVIAIGRTVGGALVVANQPTALPKSAVLTETVAVVNLTGLPTPSSTTSVLTTAISTPQPTTPMSTLILSTDTPILTPEFPTNTPVSPTNTPVPSMASNQLLLDDNPDAIAIVAGGTDVYQLHRNGKIWKYIGQPRNWLLLDDNPDAIAIVAGGTDVYQLHRNGKIWKYTGQPRNWLLLDDNPETKQVVAADGNLYQLHTNGKVWKYTGQPRNWLLLDDNPDAIAIVADNNNLYKLYKDGKIWKL